MKKVGFIGLGTMGLPMANHLLKAGYELIVSSHSKGRAKLIESQSVTVVDTPAEIASKSEVIFTILIADESVEKANLGKDGIIEGANPGLIVVDSTTIMPATSKKVALALAEKGIDFLDAPVVGSEPHAIRGELIFMAGGKKEIFDKCLPLFKTMGQDALHMGDSGTGSTVKLANNLIVGLNNLVLCEGVILAAKTGVNPEAFWTVLQKGGVSGAGSVTAEYKLPKMYNRDFAPAFKSELMYKDISLALSFAVENEVPVPILSMAKEMFRILLNKGYGQEDVCSIIKLYEEWAGVEVKK